MSTVWILQELELGFVAAWSTYQACMVSFPGKWEKHTVTDDTGATNVSWIMQEVGSEGAVYVYRLHEAKLYTQPVPIY